jgi:hypothetical protein
VAKFSDRRSPVAIKPEQAHCLPTGDSKIVAAGGFVSKSGGAAGNENVMGRDFRNSLLTVGNLFAGQD